MKTSYYYHNFNIFFFIISGIGIRIISNFIIIIKFFKLIEVSSIYIYINKYNMIQAAKIIGTGLASRGLAVLISSKDKFTRKFSISPVLSFSDNEEDMNDVADNDEDMNDVVEENKNSDSDSEMGLSLGSGSESETEPNSWHMSTIYVSLTGKSKDEAEQFFIDKEALIRADSRRHEKEIAEDYIDEGEDSYNSRIEEERRELERKLTSLSLVKNDVFDYLGIEESSSLDPSPDNEESHSPSPSADNKESSSPDPSAEDKEYSSDNSNKGGGSLIDDFADPNQFPADYTGGDD